MQSEISSTFLMQCWEEKHKEIDGSGNSPMQKMHTRLIHPILLSLKESNSFILIVLKTWDLLKRQKHL